MQTVEQVRAILRHYDGVSESPPGSNCQQFSSRCGRPCEAWCADYQSCVFSQDIGFDFALIGLPKNGTAGCAVFTGATKRAGWFSFFPREHAWVFFGPGGGSHIGYVLQVVHDDKGTATGIVTIEGNTSAPDNYAGGTVAMHTRMFGSGDDIYGYGYLPLDVPPQEDEDMPYIVKCLDPNHSKAQYAVVGGHVVLIQNAVELQAMLDQKYETHPLPSGVFDGVAKHAGE